MANNNKHDRPKNKIGPNRSQIHPIRPKSAGPRSTPYSHHFGLDSTPKRPQADTDQQLSPTRPQVDPRSAPSRPPMFDVLHRATPPRHTLNPSLAAGRWYIEQCRCDVKPGRVYATMVDFTPDVRAIAKTAAAHMPKVVDLKRNAVAIAPSCRDCETWCSRSTRISKIS